MKMEKKFSKNPNVDTLINLKWSIQNLEKTQSFVPVEKKVKILSRPFYLPPSPTQTGDWLVSHILGQG